MNQSANAPFVVCDAASFDDALGRVKVSPRGTLFLNELSEIPLEAQGRLLHVLEKHDSAQNRLDASQRMDLRMIASTSEDLRVLVSTGRFRQELYQRFATVEITVPPLRERMEDLPDLMRYFFEQFALVYGRSVLEVAEDAMERMRQCPWPGNVRELEGVLQNGVLQMGSGALELHHLPALAGQSGAEQSMIGAGGSVRLQDVVEQHVLRVLKDCGGNKLRTAEMLGISRSTLYRMLDTGAAANSLR
jgi:DNA-binding NtrC family response regulator